MRSTIGKGRFAIPAPLAVVDLFFFFAVGGGVTHFYISKLAGWISMKRSRGKAKKLQRIVKLEMLVVFLGSSLSMPCLKRESALSVWG